MLKPLIKFQLKYEYSLKESPQSIKIINKNQLKCQNSKQQTIKINLFIKNKWVLV